jgi:hypothetical protein
VLQGKPQIKFGARCPESVLSYQNSSNIKRLKKKHFETQKMLKTTKTKSTNKNSSNLTNFSAPLK